jgi:hypothetical protein
MIQSIHYHYYKVIVNFIGISSLYYKSKTRRNTNDFFVVLKMEKLLVLLQFSGLGSHKKVVIKL